MSAGSYADLAPPEPGESLYDGLMRGLRYVFEPWERSPRMLEAYHRARSGPGGKRLDRAGHGRHHAARASRCSQTPTRSTPHDIDVILRNMAYAVIGRFASGTLDITAILPTLERAVFRLTANNETRGLRRRASAGRNRGRPDSISGETYRRVGVRSGGHAAGRGDRRRVRRDRGGREVEAGRHPHLHDLRVVARDRRHVVGQHLSRRRGRRRLAPLLLLVQAAQLVAHARPPGRAAAVPRGDRRRVRPAPAPATRRDRGVGDVGRRPPRLDAAVRRRRASTSATCS